MKKWLALALVAVMALSLFVGCAGEADKETFTVGFDANFPPYGFMGEDGEYTGFDLELAAEVAKRNGWKLKLQPIEWNAKDMELDSGNISCIWNGFTINGREDGYTWTDAYMNNKQVIVVKSDSGIVTYADLAGKKVAVQTDTPALSELQSDGRKELRESFADLVVCDNYNSAFMELESGAVDAIAMDIGVAEFQIAGQESKYKFLEETLLDEIYGVGFKKGNTELRDKVQATLMEMVEDGTFETISKKWFDGRNVCILGDEK